MIVKRWHYLLRQYFVVSVLTFVGCAPSPNQVTYQAPMTGSKTTETPVPSTTKKIIMPGRGAGQLQLGDTRERVLQILGNPNKEYNYGKVSPCSYTEMNWLDTDPNSNQWGVFVYLKEGKVYQIEADSLLYATSDGITGGSSPHDVMKYHPNLQAYVLLHSGAKINGGRDLIYWVDKQTGIAFELYYDKSDRERRVAKVVVFEANTDFQPQGCIAPPRQWRELKPFSLEP